MSRHRAHQRAADTPVRPVMWSPPALHARLNAERAVDDLRPLRLLAASRAHVRRIVHQVEQRRLAPESAITQLRALTARLHKHRRVIEARREPPSWQVPRDAAALRDVEKPRV